VPEPVGVHPAIDPGFARQARKQVADVGRVEAAALQRANRRPGAGPEASPTIEPAREQRRDLLGDLSPLPWRTRIVPAGRSTSRNSSARASEIRRPQRHSTTISARLRIPVDARELQARISAIASGSESTSGGRRRGLEDEPGAAEASVTIVSLRRELDQQLSENSTTNGAAISSASVTVIPPLSSSSMSSSQLSGGGAWDRRDRGARRSSVDVPLPARASVPAPEAPAVTGRRRMPVRAAQGRRRPQAAS
jgi:hypothetical protein